MLIDIFRSQWQRAETLGALVNGVFLVALCVTIFLEAIQRMVEPQEVQNPKFVCVVGCFGLLSNILGLLLFHDHSHGHGHSHGEESLEDADAVEQGYSHVHQHDDTHDHHAHEQDTAGNGIAGTPKSNGSKANGKSKRESHSRQRHESRRFSGSAGYAGMEGIHVYPATMRQEIIAASRNDYPDPSYSSSGAESDQDQGDFQPSERTGLLNHKDQTCNYTEETNGYYADLSADDIVHQTHNHAQPKPEGKKKHSHDLNMRGVFLHVMGDALGNIGVIAAALFIWLTDYSWRFFVDPGISLVITVIILCSAIPLCKAASRILLQAAPKDLCIDHVREDIETLPGVLGSHHLHVWQLSDTKIVASVHIKVDTQIKDEGSERYMRLARQVRRCLHAYGIHSSTIQPEFAPHSDAGDNQSDAASRSESTNGQANGHGHADRRACLLECGEDCGRGGECCPKK